MKKPKPVIGVCATCGERFTTQAEMTRHPHPRIALTIRERTHMDRPELVAKAEEWLAAAERATTEQAFGPTAIECVEIAKAYTALARLAG